MTGKIGAARPPSPLRRGSCPTVLLLFVGSGGAALIYEVVWFQLIQLVIGATAVSLGVLLATFMGGMCAGQPPAAAVGRRGPVIRCGSTRSWSWGSPSFGVLILFGAPGARARLRRQRRAGLRRNPASGPAVRRSACCRPPS